MFIITSILRVRFIAAAALALVMATAAYGFAASNTVPATNAGEGSGTVSGYTASNVVYVLETADPTKLDTVTFTLTGATTAGTVKVQLVSGGTWYTAANGGSGDDWTVDPSAGSLNVNAVNTLHIVAHD
jgi:hypothetical protein